MKRRDFLKGAAIGAGVLASGMLPGKGRAASSGNTFGNKRQGVDFFRIDSYCHFSQLDYIGELEYLNGSGQPISQRALIQGIKSMYDVGDRLQMMDACGIDVSILGPQPFIETAGPGVYGNPTKALQAAQFINNEMAGIVAQHPDRLKWVALLPTNLPPGNVNIMLNEFTRVITNNDPAHPLASTAVGACFVISPTLKPPDDADYLALYQKAVELNVPLWIHPGRPLNYPDYQSDPLAPSPPYPPNTRLSKYYLFLLLGWLLDSSIAMARIAFSGVFNDTKHPELFPKLIIHHKGALVPLFQNRLTYDLYQTIGLDYGIPPGVPQPYLNLFKNFYVDTVFSGNASFETEIVQLVYDFFGPDHVLFGTDASFSTNDGKDGTLNARYSVEALQLPNKDIQNIFSNNILNIIPH